MKKNNCNEEISKNIEKCKKCPLHKTRINPVAGEGDTNSDILLIGEAPGANEDIEGKPFVGRAGKLLTKLLRSSGLSRENVYITNIIKCRPPSNRNPKTIEIDCCSDYLDKQIECIEPKTICPMGNFAAGYILSKFGIKHEPIGKVHGEVFLIKHTKKEMRVIPLYHPASAIYNRKLLTVLIDDFKKVKGKY